jgi:hypothetical protein
MQALEPLEQTFRLYASVRLNVTHDDISSARAQVTSRLEHGVCLPDTGAGTEEDPQPPALGAGLFCLDMSEKLIWIGSDFDHVVRACSRHVI